MLFSRGKDVFTLEVTGKSLSNGNSHACNRPAYLRRPIASRRSTRLELPLR